MATQTKAQIEKQIAKLQAQARSLEEADKARKDKAIQSVLTLMKKLAVDVSDLTQPSKGPKQVKKTVVDRKLAKKSSSKAGKPLTKVAPKYRDPSTGTTWSGRGRTPVWLASQLSLGRDKEDFAIQPEAEAKVLTATSSEQS
jgi:DNA-binding protein H-NS